jgi:asparagine synthase (glutamine-hydrolysing)
LLKNIITRPKKGFGIPISQWLKEDLKEPMLELLSKDRISKQGIFEHSNIETLIQGHLSNETNNRKLLWNLMCFQLWYKEFFN